MTAAIRPQYEQLGAQAFYEQHGADYRNPHEAALGAVLRAVVPQMERLMLYCRSQTRREQTCNTP